LPLALLIVVILAAATLVSYLLWPTWRNAPAALAAPQIPITVAGVLFDVPPAAIRAAVQREPGPHERVDLAFLWPSLAPPDDSAAAADQPTVETVADADKPPPEADGRLFVTLAGLGDLAAPAQRLRTIYPHYVEAEATAGREGLAILPFRAGTPYGGEDLVYVIGNPERFFARCTRQAGLVLATCINERTIGAAAITLRFPRVWLDDWQSADAGFERLIALLHPPTDAR